MVNKAKIATHYGASLPWWIEEMPDELCVLLCTQQSVLLAVTQLFMLGCVHLCSELASGMYLAASVMLSLQSLLAN